MLKMTKYPYCQRCLLSFRITQFSNSVSLILVHLLLMVRPAQLKRRSAALAGRGVFTVLQANPRTSVFLSKRPAFIVHVHSQLFMNGQLFSQPWQNGKAVLLFFQSYEGFVQVTVCGFGQGAIGLARRFCLSIRPIGEIIDERSWNLPTSCHCRLLLLLRPQGKSKK